MRNTKEEKAKDLIEDVLNLEQGIPYEQLEVINVWHCYILGNEKWMFAVAYEGLLTDDYFEVTYNKMKDEFYVDRYYKQSNNSFSNPL